MLPRKRNSTRPGRYSLSILLLSMLAALATPALAAIPTTGKPALTGVFDATWYSYDRTLAQWKGHFQNLKAIGVDTVVAQFAIVKDHYNNYPTQLSWATNFPDHSACLSNLLSAAQTKGLDVYLGIYFDEKPWWGTPNDSYLTEQAIRCNAVVEELERLYGGHPRLRGYYLPHEVVLYYWQKPADLKRLLTKFLKPVEAFIHGHTTKKFVISPFYNHALEQPAQTEAFFNTLFDGFHPDIVAPQD